MATCTVDLERLRYTVLNELSSEAKVYEDTDTYLNCPRINVKYEKRFGTFKCLVTGSLTVSAKYKVFVQCEIHNKLGNIFARCGVSDFSEGEFLWECNTYEMPNYLKSDVQSELSRMRGCINDIDSSSLD